MDQLNQDLATLQTAVSNVVADVASLPTPVPTSDPNDAVVSTVVSALESAGYTVTPPAPVADVTVEPAETETPAEDATDTPAEA